MRRGEDGALVIVVPREGNPASQGKVLRQSLAVMAADVAGYTRLTEADEENIHIRLRSLKVEVIDPCIVSHRGRITKTTGDGFIAVFESTLDAVACAIELQREVNASELPYTADRQIKFRIGLNHGTVIVEPEDVYGTEVNIAARLEQMAPAGGIIVSLPVKERVDGKALYDLESLGGRHLKNIARPVKVFAINSPGLVPSNAMPAKRRRSRPTRLPSIAILPFRSPRRTGSKSYLGQGLAQQISAGLAAIKGLMVIAHSSTLAFRGKRIDVQKVGQTLGIQYVLTGRVQQEGEEAEVYAELAEVKSGSVLWNDVFRSGRESLFDLQELIADRIVWNIAPHIRESELRNARRKRPESHDAHDCLMQAIDLIYRMSFADFVRAGELLERAIAVDSGYSAALSYYSLWKIHNVAQGWTSNIEADMQEAVRLAQAAVDCDPADGFALALLAHAKAFLQREYREAMLLFERAVDRAPSNAMVWSLSSGVYSYLGKGKEAVERARRGLRLSPTDTQAFYYLSFLGIAYHANKDYEEAVVWGRKTMSLNPRFNANLRWLIGSLVGLGQIEEAKSVARVMMKNQPRFNLTEYNGFCPLAEPQRSAFLDQLRRAGLPD